MNLLEEYISRHNLDVPFVKFETHGHSNLLLKCKSDGFINTRYLLIIISWTQEAEKPGYFLVAGHSSQHNGCKNGLFLKPVIPDERNEYQTLNYGNQMKIEWDQYNEYMLNWSSFVNCTKGFSGLCDTAEILVGLWEMFVFSYDEIFASLPEAMLESIYSTVNAELSIPDRLAWIYKVIEYLRTNIGNDKSLAFKTIYEAWQAMKSYTEPANYAFWLAKLING